MVIAIRDDGLVEMLPKNWTAPASDRLLGLREAVARWPAEMEPSRWAVEEVPHVPFPPNHFVMRKDGAFIFTPVVQPPRQLAPLNIDDVLELIGHFSGVDDDQREALQKENAALKTKPLPYPDEGEAQPLPPNPAETKLSEYGEVGDPVEEEITTEHLLDAMRANADAAGEAIGKLSSEKRRRFTELLNIELAELQQLHGAAGENLSRESEIEKLLGLFARVGEM
jgi:hypothetical protein